MTIVATFTLSTEQKSAILELWNHEYPAAISYASLTDFDSYLGKLDDNQHLLLIDGPDKINGWAFSFVRNSEVCFAIILHESIHGKGYGTMLLNDLKIKNKVLNRWVVDHDKSIKQDGSVYRSPLGFYLKNGFTTQPDVRIESDTLSAVKIAWRR